MQVKTLIQRMRNIPYTTQYLFDNPDDLKAWALAYYRQGEIAPYRQPIALIDYRRPRHLQVVQHPF